MQQPTDTTCTLACATMRDASRAVEFLVGSELQLTRLRVKMAGTVSDNLPQLESRSDAVKDWAVLVSTQGAYMELQVNQSANTVRQWAGLLSETQRSYLRRATEWNNQFQHCPGTTASPV